MRRLAIPVVSLVAIAIAIGGCGDSDDENGAGAESKKDVAVGFSSPTNAPGTAAEVLGGFRAGAEAAGWKASVADANLSPDKQAADITTMLTQGMAAIGVWTLNPGTTAGVYAEAGEKGVPIVGINSAGPGVVSNIVWQAYTCEPEGPLDQTAAYIAERRPGAKVLALGGPPVPTLQAIKKCFVDAAKKHGLAVVATPDDVKSTPATAQVVAADVLTKHPDLDAAWAFTDAAALGVSAALTAANKKISDGDGPGAMVFGMNGDTSAIEAIKAGRMTGTWDIDPGATGWALVKLMQENLDEPGKAPKEVVVESVLVTAENVGEWKPPAARGYTLENLPLLPAS